MHPARLTGAEGTREGLKAIRLSAVALGASAAIRLTIAALSGSVALLAAGLDDLGDVATTVGLSLAFVASRRAADRRYTFGYQRVEDLSGVLVVLVIWGSAGFATFEAVSKLTGDHEITRLGIAMAAAGLGLLANGFAGFYKIAVGRRIGSEPLISDGKHALTDGLASIAALAGLIGVKMGWAEADPIAAFVVVAAIVLVAVDASRNVLTRLLDAVDPEIVNHIENIVLGTPGVAGCGRIQARWAGRSLYVSVTVAAEGTLPLSEAHEITERLHHRILHEVEGVAQVDVHVDPWEPHGPQAHAGTADHDERTAADSDAQTHPH